MAEKRESERIRDMPRRILDEAARKRRLRKAIEALEADNYQMDPHADLKMSKKAPKFDESLAKQRKIRKKGDNHKFKMKKSFTNLLEEEQCDQADGPNYLNISVPPSKFPPRHFCAVCGFPSSYTCVTCGTRYCCVRCLGTHLDTRCMKYTA